MTSLFPEATDRDPLDFNRTPAWVVELLIPELGQPATILDAGCGDGAIGKVLAEHLHPNRLKGVEIDKARANKAFESAAYNSIWHIDWLAEDVSRDKAFSEVDLIISNPPFGLAALDFIRCAIARIRPGGTVAFLLPTHWAQDVDELCGPDAPKTKDRELYRQRLSHEQYARQRFLDSIRLPNGHEGYAKLEIVGGGPNPCRPSFRGGPNTATDRYAWFMFGEKWAGQPSRRLHAIPKAETSTQLEIVK